MTLNLAIAASITGAYDASSGLISGVGTVDISAAIALGNGTAAGQADGVYTSTGSLAAGQAETFGLANGLIDIYGQDLQFSAVKVLYVVADPGNTDNIILGGGTWAGPFSAASNALSIRPGQIAMLVCQDPTGWPVAAGSDALNLRSAAAGVFTIIIAGVSNNISPPVCTVQPAIVGTPQTGSVLALSAGAFSGSPTFGYQWKRGGSILSGATSSTYTPVSGDVANNLTCTITATNAAGAIAVTTAGVLVPA